MRYMKKPKLIQLANCLQMLTKKHNNLKTVLIFSQLISKISILNGKEVFYYFVNCYCYV